MLRSSKSAARDAALVSICTFPLEKQLAHAKKGIPHRRNNTARWEKACRQAASKQAIGGDDPASRNASFAGKGVESLPGVAAEYVPKGAKSSDSGLDLDVPELKSAGR